MRYVLTALVALALLAGIVAAQSGGGYSLTWSTIDGGGATSAGGSYTLAGTIGQPDAGALSGGGYSLDGGFWPSPIYPVYVPLVQR